MEHNTMERVLELLKKAEEIIDNQKETIELQNQQIDAYKKMLSIEKERTKDAKQLADKWEKRYIDLRTEMSKVYGIVVECLK